MPPQPALSVAKVPDSPTWVYPEPHDPGPRPIPNPGTHPLHHLELLQTIPYLQTPTAKHLFGNALERTRLRGAPGRRPCHRRLPWVPPAEGRSESDSVLPFLLPAAQPVKPQNSKTPLQTRRSHWRNSHPPTAILNARGFKPTPPYWRQHARNHPFEYFPRNFNQ